MSKKVKTKKFDSFASIAKDHGIPVKIVKLMPENKGLKSEFDFLEEGQTVTLRDIEKKEVSRPTDSKHTFQIDVPEVKACDCFTEFKFGTDQRKVKYPVDPVWGEELYVVADKDDGSRLYAEVESEVVLKNACPRGHRAPLSVIQNDSKKQEAIKETVKVYTVDEGLLSDNFPIVQMLRKAWLLATGDLSSSTAVSKLQVCSESTLVTGRPLLKVRAYDPFEASMDVALLGKVVIATDDATLDIGTEGNTSFKYGRFEASKKHETELRKGKADKKPAESKEELPEDTGKFIKLITESLQALAKKAEKANKSDDGTGDDGDGPIDTNGVSSITLESKIGIKIGSLKLEENSDGPGLFVGIDSFTLSWDPFVSLKGRLDLIDVIATAVNAPAAKLIREARQMIASGKKVNGRCDAYAESRGSIGGSWYLKPISGRVPISPLDDEKLAKEDEAGTLDLKGEIGLDIVVGVHMQAQVFWVKTEGAAEAKAESAFKYTARKTPDGVWQSQKQFTGITLKMAVLVKIGYSSTDVLNKEDIDAKRTDKEDKVTKSVSGLDSGKKGEFVIADPRPKVPKWEKWSV